MTDSEQDAFLAKIIDEIVDRVTADCSKAEKIAITMLIAEQAVNAHGTTKLKARLHSILSEYYNIIEGLQK